MTDACMDAESFDREVEDFDRKRLAIFETLIKELVKASADVDSSDFGRVFSHAQSVLGISDLQMSLLFKVSRPTIGRWTRNVTAPHRFVRKAVYDTLLHEANNSLKGLRHQAK